MNTKHTPGPWTFDRVTNGKTDWLTVYGYHEQVVATMPDMSNETIINAKLIAAAPELLGALRAALNELYRTGGDYRITDTVESVIKKATE